MKINMYRPEVGDKVTFNGYTKEQVMWGNNDTPYMLILGRTYKIEDVDVHNSHTKVKLKGIVGLFNSVHFSLQENN